MSEEQTRDLHVELTAVREQLKIALEGWKSAREECEKKSHSDPSHVQIEGIYEKALKTIADSHLSPPWDRPDPRQIAVTALSTVDRMYHVSEENETE